MKVTVQYLINQPYMDKATVLCCEKKLANVVDGINFLEYPKENLTMLKNTMIITDGSMLEKLTDAEFINLMKMYNTIRVAALCIRAKAEDDVLKKAVAEAIKVNLPVLLLPEDTIVSTIISGVTYEILYANGYNLSSSYESNFFQEMIFTEQDPQMIVKRARMMGVRVNEYLCVILIRPSKPVDIVEFTYQCKNAWGASSFATSKNGYIMLIGRLTCQYSMVNQLFSEMAEKMRERLEEKYKNVKMCIGVGHCYESVANLRRSYYSAKTAMITAVSNTFQKNMVVYDQLGIYKILFDIRNREDISKMREETVDRIREYDREHSAEFYNTITTYLDSFCSVQETAKRLFVHYNTIRYRISKIKSVFGWDLFSMEDCINLAISLRIDKFLIDEDSF